MRFSLELDMVKGDCDRCPLLSENCACETCTYDDSIVYGRHRDPKYCPLKEEKE